MGVNPEGSNTEVMGEVQVSGNQFVHGFWNQMAMKGITPWTIVFRGWGWFRYTVEDGLIVLIEEFYSNSSLPSMLLPGCCCGKPLCCCCLVLCGNPSFEDLRMKFNMEFAAKDSHHPLRPAPRQQLMNAE